MMTNRVRSSGSRKRTDLDSFASCDLKFRGGNNTSVLLAAQPKIDFCLLMYCTCYVEHSDAFAERHELDGSRQFIARSPGLVG
jgi:hypothetical protein